MSDLEKVLFLDIETVPQKSNYQDISDTEKDLWDKKAAQLMRFQDDESLTSEKLYERGGIYAEFGCIICVSVGFYHKEGKAGQFRVRSFYKGDEKNILLELFDLLNHYFPSPYRFLCAHNGKEFDFPYICRRALINRVPLPKALQVSGKKPWETNHLLDTMQAWRFGDYKHFTSLELLAHCFGIPSPKDDISGADVAEVYYAQNDIERIRLYCENDVYTMARVFCAMNELEDISPESLQRVD